MNIQDIEILLDRKLDEKLDTKFNQQRQEYEHYIGVVVERISSENKMTYELLSGEINFLKDTVVSIQEMVAQNTEDISQNTEDITELKDYLKMRVG